MTDAPGWTPPEPASASQPTTPWSAPPPPGAAWPPGVPVAGPGTGWTAPPKPGLVPLRPMTLGTILGAMFQVMRRNPLPTFGLALLLSLAAGVITAGLLVAAFVPLDASGFENGPGILGAAALAIVGAVVGAVAQLFVTSIVQGVVTLEVASGTLGERMRLAGLWRRLRSRLPRLIGWLLLVAAASTVALGILVALVAGIAALGRDAVLPAVLVAVVGVLGMVVATAWLGVKLLFVTPAIVLERRGVFASVARSWRLTRGSFWRIFGILLLVLVIYYVASLVISFPIQIIGSIAVAFVGGGISTDPADGSGLVAGGVLWGVLLLVSWLVGAVGLVMISATVALLHIDTRMRREGLDQDLVRAAEARAAGVPHPDPYADPAGAAVRPDSPWA